MFSREERVFASKVLGEYFTASIFMTFTFVDFSPAAIVDMMTGNLHLRFIMFEG
jgi:hypothetical protein